MGNGKAVRALLAIVAVIAACLLQPSHAGLSSVRVSVRIGTQAKIKSTPISFSSSRCVNVASTLAAAKAQVQVSWQGSDSSKAACSAIQFFQAQQCTGDALVTYTKANSSVKKLPSAAKSARCVIDMCALCPANSKCIAPIDNRLVVTCVCYTGYYAVSSACQSSKTTGASTTPSSGVSESSSSTAATSSNTAATSSSTAATSSNAAATSSNAAETSSNTAATSSNAAATSSNAAETSSNTAATSSNAAETSNNAAEASTNGAYTSSIGIYTTTNGAYYTSTSGPYASSIGFDTSTNGGYYTSTNGAYTSSIGVYTSTNGAYTSSNTYESPVLGTMLVKYKGMVMVPFLKPLLDTTGRRRDGLVVLDSYRGHLTEAVGQTMQMFWLSRAIIPGGCTLLVQPLDVSVNRAFKCGVRHRYSLWFEKEGINLTTKAVPMPAEELQAAAHEDDAAEEDAEAAAAEEEGVVLEEGGEAEEPTDDEWWRPGRYDGEECEEWHAGDDSE
ncbi:unnamed protein product [Closterium sp. Yama58-4]|nr:unnamed protein product [Closterium sp. Yama58-4]